MSQTTTASAPAFPTATILTLIFVTLKLTGVLAWSWWWVLAPIWITFGIVAVLILAILAVAFAKGWR